MSQWFLGEMSTRLRCGTSARHRLRGGAALEMALLSPWVFFLFIGALDWGFYSSALISVQAALRSATLYTATGASTAADSAGACSIVLAEIRTLPNIGPAVTSCGSNPVVTATAVTGPDNAAATQVTITYNSVKMIPLPGMLAGQFTIAKTAKMRLRTGT